MIIDIVEYKYLVLIKVRKYITHEHNIITLFN